MDEKTAARLIVANGKELLDGGLVARTWGNISCRLDEKECMITPSGLDYSSMKEENIVRLNMDTGEWNGKHKPSGEKGIHMAAYRSFPHIQFIIHTHQNFASAIGLAGFEQLDIRPEERQRLGGLGIAGYGLPGTKKLTNNVRAALAKGDETILMAHHGAMICGKSREEAMERALLLEEICKRNVKGFPEDMPAAWICAEKKISVYAQLDDMAQMIGKTIPIVSQERAKEALDKKNAVLVPGVGAMVRACNKDDEEALRLLVEKACICRLHTRAAGVKAALGATEVALMHYVYCHKYSKQKTQGEA